MQFLSKMLKGTCFKIFFLKSIKIRIYYFKNVAHLPKCLYFLQIAGFMETSLEEKLGEKSCIQKTYNLIWKSSLVHYSF